MNDREKKRLSRQLVQQAKQLEQQDGAELSASLVTVCTALLRAAWSPKAPALPEEAFDALYARYLGLSQEAEGFFQEAVRRFQGRTAQAGALETLRAQAERLRGELDAAEAERRALKEQAVQNQARLDKVKKQLENAQDAHQALENLLKQYTPEKVEAQRAENEALAQRVGDSGARLRALQEERSRLKAELRQTEEALDQVPQENQVLLAQFEAQQALLERLRTAQETCTPERQQEMQREIDALGPVVEENQQAVQLLEHRLEDLKGQYVQYDRERQTLSTNVLEETQRSLTELQAALTGHEDRLGAIREQAEALSGRLAACQEARRQYRDWLEADRTPLEAMIEALGRPEAEELRRTLDPGSVQTVRDLQNDLEERLRQLDEILDRCVQAVQTDRAAVDKRARR